MEAGGSPKIAWSEDSKSFFYPMFSSHAIANKFWHGKTEEYKAWAIGELFIVTADELKGDSDGNHKNS